VNFTCSCFVLRKTPLGVDGASRRRGVTQATGGRSNARMLCNLLHIGPLCLVLC
jgi:hypothetical protein